MTTSSDPTSLVSRRVVIGPAKDGRGDVLSDIAVGPLDRAPAGERQVQLAELWRVDGPLQSVVEGGDPALDPWQMVPASGGVAWRMVRWGSSSPKMHRTDTLDFLMILAGAIDLEHESGRVRLGVGDSVVIQDALHAWHLVDGEPCVALAVMLRPSPATR
jgi:mannose-6-phosphate isomerase-like protein (cupin superfamily)